MRFVPDGPAIPNDLIRKWRDGKVLFLAGAGVSRPAGLPLFKGLALDIYQHLNDSVYGPLADGEEVGRRERVLTNDQLSDKQKIEAELFLDNQLDRLFAAMEARLDHDDSGRLAYRKVRDALEVVLRRAPTFAQVLVHGCLFGGWCCKEVAALCAHLVTRFRRRTSPGSANTYYGR